MNEINKAEYTQALNAFLIPSSLFISCLLGAAGIFLVREGYGLGWAFIALSGLIMVWAFWAFITFQNKLRAKGLMLDQYDSPAPIFDGAEPAEKTPDLEQDKKAVDDSSDTETPLQTLSFK